MRFLLAAANEGMGETVVLGGVVVSVAKGESDVGGVVRAVHRCVGVRDGAHGASGEPELQCGR